MSRSKRESPSRLLLALMVFAGPAYGAGVQQVDQLAQQFTGTYDGLKPPPLRLIDDWIVRYEKVSGKSLDPKSTFDSLALSVKTTFQAALPAAPREGDSCAGARCVTAGGQTG